MNAKDRNALIRELGKAERSIDIFHEILVGRDTHPLYDEGMQSPEKMYAALEGMRLLHQVRSLKNELECIRDFKFEVGDEAPRPPLAVHREFWVARDLVDGRTEVQLYTGKPTMIVKGRQDTHDGIFHPARPTTHLVAAFTNNEWQAFTSFPIERGECKHITLLVEDN